MIPVVYFHPEGYTTRGPKLMGRHAAGESFLRAYFENVKGPAMYAQVAHPDHGKFFEQAARQAGRQEPVRIAQRHTMQQVAKDGAVIQFPGPGIGEEAWKRSFSGDDAWCLTGITHTTSSAGAMDSIANLVAAPVQAWDALICTSSAVKANVEAILRAQAEHFARRLGARRILLPQLPVIPLGVHTRDFEFTPDERASARASIGAGADAIVVLFLGRLSFHAKAHPLAMYQALETAAKETGREVLLVECGWFGNDGIAGAFEEAARFACPSVRVVNVDGRDPALRRGAWAGADVFCSLSDNIQETFGIAPIEAMAAGLPVVATDWDGYKDTIADGEVGFRVPTTAPQSGLGQTFAARHALEVDTYDRYCGYTCNYVSVDVGATTRAFVQLFTSPELRARMGAAGRERARTLYDWAVVMEAYQALWELQDDLRRKANTQETRVRHPWPARLDPFHSFRQYPTRPLDGQVQLRRVLPDEAEALERFRRIRRLQMNDFADTVLPGMAIMEAMLRNAGVQYQPASQLVETVRASVAERWLALSWLLKMNLLEARDILPRGQETAPANSL